MSFSILAASLLFAPVASPDPGGLRDADGPREESVYERCVALVEAAVARRPGKSGFEATELSSAKKS